MGQTTLLTVTLFLAVSCIYFTDGFNCYSCTYFENDEGESVGDKSCKIGKPDLALSEDCSLSSTMQLSKKEVTVAEFLASQGLSNRRVKEWACAKRFFDGEAKDIKYNMTGVGRFCYPITDEELTCKNDTLQGWRDTAQNGDSWARYISSYTSFLTGSAEVSACLCGEENCNMESEN